MGKRAAARAGILGWIAVLTPILGFLFLTSWNRSMQGVDTAAVPAPAASPTHIANATEQEEPTFAPAEEARPQTPDEASSDVPGTPFSFPGFDFINRTLEERRWKKQREQERQAILDAVAGETIEESVRNLLTHDLSRLFSPHWRSIANIEPYWDAMTMCDELKADPRIAKLLETIQQGSETEVGVLYDELRKAIDAFLHDLPLSQPMGEPSMPTVMDPWDGNALPLLLAAFPPSVEHLQLLIAMADTVDRANQQDFRGTFPDRPEDAEPPWTPTSTVLAYSADRVLSRLADEEVRGGTLSSEQRAVLDSYVEFREELRALAVAMIEDDVSHDLAGPDALDALADPSFVDSYSSVWAAGLGRYKQPRETGTAYRREREVLAFAEALCIAANQQTGGDSQ